MLGYGQHHGWVKRFWSEREGGIVLEAAVVLPLFLAFALAMASVIKLTVTDMALQHALTETVKQMAANAYPVELLAGEVRQAYERSPVSGTVDSVLGQVRTARDAVMAGEQWIRDYRAFIPEFLVQWIEWERQQREQLEQLGNERYESFRKEHVDPVIHEAFRAVVMQSADERTIDGSRLRVVRVQLPKLGDPGKALLGIEAEYEVRLPVPFYRKTVRIHKQAYERIWTGA